VKAERRVYLNAFLIGVIFFFIQLVWLRHVTYLAWILLSLYCALYFLFFAFCVRRITFRLRLPLFIVIPCVWVSLEYVRSFLFSGFPWYFAGHTQHHFLPLIQACDITGVAGISFIVLLVNACITEIVVYCLEKYGKTHIGNNYEFLFLGRKRFWGHLTWILPVFLLGGMLLYGFLWLRKYHPHQGPVVCLVQGNIPQEVKFDSTEEEEINILKKYTDLSFKIKGEPLDLLVWPETMIPGLLNIDPELTGRKIDFLSQLTALQLAQELHTNVLLGGIALELNGEEQLYYNSAYYYNRRGKLVDRYDKIHLVPFGEYTPLKKYFPFLSKLVPYHTGLSSGRERTLFDLKTLQNKDFTFGVSVCYEDTVSPLIRKFKNDGADFLFNITNDGWFRNSAELEQHLAIMVFRAVENRIGMARAANTGISAFIGPDGTVYDQLADDSGRRKEISGVLKNRMKFIKNEYTFYSICGDWFFIFCSVIFGALLFCSFLNTLSLTFYKKSTYNPTFI